MININVELLYQPYKKLEASYHNGWHYDYIYTVFSLTTLIIVLINIITEVYKTKPTVDHIPVTLHTQILKFLIISCAIIIAISYIADISLTAFVTILGAAVALLTFIFKDTILGPLASLQLTFQDIIRIGNWASVPQYNADGSVEEITIIVVTKVFLALILNL